MYYLLETVETKYKGKHFKRFRDQSISYGKAL